MDDGAHKSGWTPAAVWVNTLATALGSLTGVSALIVAVIALIKST